jgi:branched-chain amino acid transport system substrate-binding protein|tara:strand:+ start:62 stop:1165 length:1104 start_codon:yes stop_codon:yes gene_type:complete
MLKNLKKSISLIATFLMLGSLSVKADITVAAAGPMSGQYASFGAQFKAGAEMWLKDVNAKGGINGEKVKLVIGDDACDPKQAVSVANKFVGQGVVYVAGHFCSSSSIPASKVYTEEGIIQVSPASTATDFTDKGGKNVFRVCGRDDQQGETAGLYLGKNFAGKKVAIIHDKSAYGKGLADETRKNMKKAGLKAAMYEAFTAGEKDYSALVSKIKANNIDAVYLGGYHTEGGLIVRQMRDQGMNTQLISGDALVTSEYWDITGKAGEGTLMTFSPDPRNNPEAAPLVKEFKAAGIDPEGYVLYTYASLQVFEQAATKAGSTDYKKLLKAMKKTTFKTVLGDLTFDKKGDVSLPGYVFYEWSNGDYKQL